MSKPHSKKTIHFLKKETTELIADSRAHDYGGKEDDGDWLDQSIIDTIEQINRHPEIAITGSCSGHSGYPFISLIFATVETRDRILRKFRKLGYMTHADLTDTRDEFFRGNYPSIRVYEECDIGTEQKLSSRAAKKFWADCLEILEYAV